MPLLSTLQRAAFRRDGIIRLENAVEPAQMGQLCMQFDRWVEESKRHTKAFGQMLDGRPRFDVEPGHCAEHPALRRVASPTELSDPYFSVLTQSRAVDAAAELIGPDLRFHHSKLNSKLPGAATTVKWHQDFPFDPHSNDDLITIILFLDDVSEENGPLRASPGSHRGPLYSLWHDGRFTGTVSKEAAQLFEQTAVSFTGPRGTAILMHTRLAHASGENRSAQPRTLFIFNVASADAVPLTPCSVPSMHEGLIIRGDDPGRVRCTAYQLETPEIPTGASFFEQQAG